MRDREDWFKREFKVAIQEIEKARLQLLEDIIREVYGEKQEQIAREERMKQEQLIREAAAEPQLNKADHESRPTTALQKIPSEKRLNGIPKSARHRKDNNLKPHATEYDNREPRRKPGNKSASNKSREESARLEWIERESQAIVSRAKILRQSLSAASRITNSDSGIRVSVRLAFDSCESERKYSDEYGPLATDEYLFAIEADLARKIKAMHDRR